MATQRGRKSLASVSTAVIPRLVKDDRLAPPAHITDAERDVWLQAVNDQPPQAFSEVHIPLMEMYCRHVVYSRIMAEELLNFSRHLVGSGEGIGLYDKMLKIHEREVRAAVSIATKLRITRQAVDQATIARMNTKHQQKTRAKPWEQLEQQQEPEEERS